MSDDFVFPEHGLECTPIPRVDIGSEEAARLVALEQPFVASVADWPLMNWTPQYIEERIGDEKVTLTTPLREKEQVTIREFLRLVDNPEEHRQRFIMQNAPVIILRNYMLETPASLRGLAGEVPLPDFIDEENVDGMYLWFRNVGKYDNRSHAEPNAMANLNCQISGKKHVWLFNPEDVRFLDTEPSILLSPYFPAGQRAHSVAEHPPFKNARCYETVLEAGDAVFIPTFWFHWFVHYDAYQINMNCWFQTRQRALHPLSASWAYGNALVSVLGGAGVAEDKFAELAPEVQELLQKIQQEMIDVPSLLRPKDWIASQRPNAKPLEFDPKLYEDGES